MVGLSQTSQPDAPSLVSNSSPSFIILAPRSLVFLLNPGQPPLHLSLYPHLSQDEDRLRFVKTLPRDIEKRTISKIHELEPRVIKKATEILDWNDKDLLLAVLELLPWFARLAPDGVITKANIEQNDDLVHLNKILSYVCMVAKTNREELFVKPKSSVEKNHAGDTGHIIQHEIYKKLFQSVFKQKSS